jgi:hypothetical protein
LFEFLFKRYEYIYPYFTSYSNKCYTQVHAACWYRKKYVFKTGKKRKKKIYTCILCYCVLSYILSLNHLLLNFSSNDTSLDFLSFHFLNTTFDLIAIKANGQWLVSFLINMNNLKSDFFMNIIHMQKWRVTSMWYW